MPGANTPGVPVDGKVLLDRVTTSGTTEALVNVQFRDANQESFYASGMPLVFPVAGAGCSDEMACNYNPLDKGDGDYISQLNSTTVMAAERHRRNGVCDELEVLGCTDNEACNFDLAATEEDGSCTTLDECGICGGDGTGCRGCASPSADNYDADALADDGSCTFGNGLCTG